MATNKRIICECSDPGCPAHPGVTHCERRAIWKLYRIDMEDRSGAAMCAVCANDALESGVFDTDPVRPAEEVSNDDF